MAEHIAFSSDITARNVLLINGNAKYSEIHNCAGMRMEAVRNMLFSLSSINLDKCSSADGRDIQHIAHAAYVLLADITDMMDVAEKIYRREVAHD